MHLKLPLMRRRAMWGGLLLLGLAGCKSVHYDYVPPPSDHGRMCASQCAMTREMCYGNEKELAQRRQESCEHRRDTDYRACMRHARTKDAERACSRQRSSCYESASTYRCDENFRGCYTTCGGAVLRYEK